MGKQSRVGKKTRENKRKQKELDFDPWLDKQPHSLIIHNPGKSVGKNTQHLVNNFRQVMEPFTATSVKVQKTNRLKDFISIAATINVSHIFVFNKTEDKLNLRIMKLPRGPTLWFNVSSYSLEKDIQSSLARPHADQHLSKDAAMCLMSGFNDEKKQSKLAKTFIKNMFPTTNIPTLNLDNVRRVVIWEWNDETEEIDFRQFVISKTPVGVGKKVKKLFEASNAANKALPKLGNLEEVAYFLEYNMVFTSGVDSDGGKSEADEAKVEIKQEADKKKIGNAAEVWKIRLTEYGPRMTLKLTKIQEGVNDGEVLYHAYEDEREESEVQKLGTAKRTLEIEKKKRKANQMENIEKKRAKKEAIREKAIEVQMKREEENKKDKKDTKSQDKADKKRESRENEKGYIPGRGGKKYQGKKD
jgi:ribosome biogenesis protein SSF1/2